MSTNLEHLELDRLERTTLEIRWLIIVPVLAALAVVGQLSPTVWALAGAATLSTLTRTLSLFTHWHHFGGRRTILIVDFAFLTILGLVTHWDPPLLGAIFLLPIAVAAIWYGLEWALIAAAVATAILVTETALLSTLDRQLGAYLILLSAL